MDCWTNQAKSRSFKRRREQVNRSYFLQTCLPMYQILLLLPIRTGELDCCMVEAVQRWNWLTVLTTVFHSLHSWSNCWNIICSKFATPQRTKECTLDDDFFILLQIRFTKGHWPFWPEYITVLLLEKFALICGRINMFKIRKIVLQNLLFGEMYW